MENNHFFIETTKTIKHFMENKKQTPNKKLKNFMRLNSRDNLERDHSLSEHFFSNSWITCRTSRPDIAFLILSMMTFLREKKVRSFSCGFQPELFHTLDGAGHHIHRRFTRWRKGRERKRFGTRAGRRTRGRGGGQPRERPPGRAEGRSGGAEERGLGRAEGRSRGAEGPRRAEGREVESGPGLGSGSSLARSAWVRVGSVAWMRIGTRLDRMLPSPDDTFPSVLSMWAIAVPISRTFVSISCERS
jgi:hypothetical protein